MIETNVIVSNL